MPGRERGRQKTCCEGNAPKGHGLDCSVEARHVPRKIDGSIKAEHVPRKIDDSGRY